MICQGCGKTSYSINGWMEEGIYREVCNQCGNPVNSYVPDVYLGRIGQTFQNLCDKMGRPYEIRSKAHKKQIMDKLNVSEAAGTVHGAPLEPTSWIDGSRDFRRRQFDKERPAIREGYKRWKGTGYAREH